MEDWVKNAAVDLQTPPPSEDWINQAGQDLTQQTDSTIQASLDNALKTKPEAHAKTLESAKTLNIPIEVAERNSQEVNQIVKRDQLANKLNDTEWLKKAFTDPDFAAVAQDDVDNLSNWEFGLRALKNVGGAGMAGAAQTPANINDALAGITNVLSEYGTKPLARWGVIPEDFFGRMTKELTDMNEASDLATKYWRAGQEGAGPTEAAIYSGVESTTNMMFGLLSSIATGTPAAALTWGGLQEGGRSVGEAMDKGQSPLVSLGYGVTNAMIEVGTELAPALQLLNDLKLGSSFFKTMMGQMATEIPQEQVATMLQDLNEFVILRPDATFGDYIAERPMAGYQTLVSTVVGTGLNTSLAQGSVKVLEKLSGTSYPETLGDAPRAQAATRVEGTLQELNDIASNIELRKHSPEAFSQLTEQISKEIDIENIYVDSEQFFQAIEESDISIEDLPSLEDQIEYVKEHGGDFQIPLSEYMANVAGTNLGEALTQHARFNPEDMSAFEAATWQKESEERFKDEAEKILQESKEKEIVQESANRVRDSIRDEIIQSGRYTKDVANKDAELHKNFAIVMANKYPGKFPTPESVYEKYGLGVEGIQPEAGIEYEQLVQDETLGKMEVNVKAVEEETGRVVSIKERADVALQDATDSIDDMQRLITCLRG